MLFVKSLASKRYTLLATSISLNREIISPCSYYTKKGLVCVIIIFFSSCQPSSYLKCTKANTCLLCDVRLIPLNKCISLYLYARYCAYYNLLIP